MKETRIDFVIEEAGCLIWVAPYSLGGVTPAELGQIWMGQGKETTKDLVARGAMMPMSLYQDDGYLVRFIVGDLNEQEESEWVARARWKLDVPCGRVLVSGILSPDCEQEFAAIEPAEANGAYWAGAYTEVTPGLYQVDVYSYAPGDLSSGWGMITNWRTFGKHPDLKPEKEMDYFRRTRPQEQAPAWIDDEPEERLYINFIVRLSPLTTDMPQPGFEEDGCIKWEFRKPDIFPLGIRSDIKDE